jgi:hypothetical protein
MEEQHEVDGRAADERTEITTGSPRWIEFRRRSDRWVRPVTDGPMTVTRAKRRRDECPHHVPPMLLVRLPFSCRLHSGIARALISFVWRAESGPIRRCLMRRGDGDANRLE